MTEVDNLIDTFLFLYNIYHSFSFKGFNGSKPMFPLQSSVFSLSVPSPFALFALLQDLSLSLDSNHQKLDLCHCVTAGTMIYHV